MAIRFCFCTVMVAGVMLFVTATSVVGAGVHVEFAPLPTTVSPGDTFTVALTVTPGDDLFNAFDFVVAYDPARLAFVPTAPLSDQRGALMTSACPNLFHLFTPTPGALQITLSLLCNNVFVTGPGVIYRVRFTALGPPGLTTITCGAGTQFYRAGFFVDPLHCTPLAIDVGGTSAVPEPRQPGSGVWLAPPRPNPQVGPGAMTIGCRLERGDVVRVSLFDSAGRLTAARPEVFMDAGFHSIDWSLPDLPGGVYFLHLSTDAGVTVSRRWVLLR